MPRSPAIEDTAHLAGVRARLQLVRELTRIVGAPLTADQARELLPDDDAPSLPQVWAEAIEDAPTEEVRRPRRPDTIQ